MSKKNATPAPKKRAETADTVRILEVEPIVVTAKQAAQLLCVCPRTLHKLTYPRGPIRPAKLGKDDPDRKKGGILRYPVENLKSYIRSLSEECEATNG